MWGGGVQFNFRAPLCGMQMQNANSYPTRYSLQSNSGQNKKLFSDNALAAFCRDKRNTRDNYTAA